MIIILSGESQREYALGKIQALDLSSRYKVTIEEYVPDITMEQRGFFHVLCSLIGEATGYTQGEVKQLVKKYLWGTVHVEIGGTEYEVLQSSEKANRAEYSQLIEAAYQIGAEAGVPLPPPLKDFER